MEFKKYNHLKEEKKISDFWIKKGLFKPKKNKTNKKFSIVITPPNVTGRLHMGHALNNSLQDLSSSNKEPENIPSKKLSCFSKISCSWYLTILWNLEESLRIFSSFNPSF